MPTAFQKELGTLADRLADLCALVAIALEDATRAVLESDHTLGGRGRDDAAALAVACEDQAGALSALHTPREEDVKAVAGAVHTAADLTRMGGLAQEVAQPQRRVPPAALGRLGGHAVASARALRELLAGESGARLADAVALAAVAERELRDEASGSDWPLGAQATVEVTLLAAACGAVRRDFGPDRAPGREVCPRRGRTGRALEAGRQGDRRSSAEWLSCPAGGTGAGTAAAEAPAKGAAAAGSPAAARGAATGNPCCGYPPDGGCCGPAPPAACRRSASSFGIRFSIPQNVHCAEYLTPIGKSGMKKRVNFVTAFRTACEAGLPHRPHRKVVIAST